MGEDYDPTKPIKFIQYLNANNLYGSAMCESLPVGGFKWMTDEEMENWEDIPCIMEVDMGSVRRNFMISTMIIHWLLRG